MDLSHKILIGNLNISKCFLFLRIFLEYTFITETFDVTSLIKTWFFLQRLSLTLSYFNTTAVFTCNYCRYHKAWINIVISVIVMQRYQQSWLHQWNIDFFILLHFLSLDREFSRYLFSIVSRRTMLIIHKNHKY